MAKLGQFDPSKMTEQEVFDEGVRHLLTQKKKSIHYSPSGPDCMYKGPGELCCAAAPFVVNYSQEMETKPYHTLVNVFKQPEDHEFLIRQLQVVHDHSDIYEWRRDLFQIGINNGLSLSVFDEFEDK